MNLNSPHSIFLFHPLHLPHTFTFSLLLFPLLHFPPPLWTLILYCWCRDYCAAVVRTVKVMLPIFLFSLKSLPISNTYHSENIFESSINMFLKVKVTWFCKMHLKNQLHGHQDMLITYFISCYNNNLIKNIMIQIPKIELTGKQDSCCSNSLGYCFSNIVWQVNPALAMLGTLLGCLTSKFRTITV